MTKPFNDTREQVIATDIACIKNLLENALQSATESEQAISNKEQNQAVGWLLNIEPMLMNAKALYDATIYMHRNCQ